MLICILGLYMVSARARRRFAIGARMRAARLTERWATLRRLAEPRAGIGGPARRKHNMSSQEE
jgi:hypothetical protein